MPKVKVETGTATIASSAAPNSPRTIDTRRNTIAVNATCAASPVPTDAAICRTPLLLIPISAVLRVRSAIARYMPNRPKPAGPSSIAMAFVRTSPIRRASRDEPPISTDDTRISWWDVRTLRFAG